MADRLNPGEKLVHGESLCTRNNSVVLELLDSGNLILKHAREKVWETGTEARGTIVRMQEDGNFVLVAEGNIPIWHTGTNDFPGAYLQLFNNGGVGVVASNNEDVLWLRPQIVVPPPGPDPVQCGALCPIGGHPCELFAGHNGRHMCTSGHIF
jgi:hypothetical protein